MIICVYLPLVLGIAGVVLTVRVYLSTRATGYLPVAAVFCIPAATAIAQWVQVQRFVSVEIEPGVWSTPVLRGSLPVLAMQGLLLVGVLLLSRKGKATLTSEQSVGGDSGKAADGLTEAPQR